MESNSKMKGSKIAFNQIQQIQKIVTNTKITNDGTGNQKYYPTESKLIKKEYSELKNLSQQNSLFRLHEYDSLNASPNVLLHINSSTEIEPSKSNIGLHLLSIKFGRFEETVFKEIPLVDEVKFSRKCFNAEWQAQGYPPDALKQIKSKEFISAYFDICRKRWHTASLEGVTLNINNCI